jgi:hypothetical protein
MHSIRQFRLKPGFRNLFAGFDKALLQCNTRLPICWARRRTAGQPLASQADCVNLCSAGWRMSLSHAMDGGKSEADHCDCAG